MKEKTVFSEIIRRFKDYFNIHKINRREVIRRCLMLVCAAAFFIAGFQIVNKYYWDYVTQKNYEHLKIDPQASKPADNAFDEVEEDPSSFQLLNLDSMTELLNTYYARTSAYTMGDFLTASGTTIGVEYLDSMRNINSDIIGYIKIEDTNIDYFVMQYRLDNEYYLKHDIELSTRTAGSIFMDYRNRAYSEDLNTILYGHNMKNGSMFRNLHNYSDKEFAMSHQFITFNTLEENRTWQVFTCYTTVTDFNYIQTDFKSAEEYSDFLRECKSKSMYKFDITPTSSDRILTLSTCNSDGSKRFVVQCVLVERS